MSLGEHRDVLPFFCEAVEQVDQLVEYRHECLLDGVADKHRYGSVVDVLRGQSEVDEFLVGFEAEHVKFLLDKIFYGLHIVIGHAFDVLHALSVVDRKLIVDFTQLREQRAVDVFQLWQRQAAESDEIFDFNLHSVADERILRVVVLKNFDFVAITTVDGGNRCQ